MLELAAGKHVEGFTSLSDIGVTAGGPVKVPIDLSSLACGLVSTDGKAPSAAGSKPNTPPTSKQPTNGGPWATLSQYLQQHITAGEFDKHLPFPQKTAGRLEPHEEAANKGWYFGNVSPHPPLRISSGAARICLTLHAVCEGHGTNQAHLPDKCEDGESLGRAAAKLWRDRLATAHPRRWFQN